MVSSNNMNKKSPLKTYLAYDAGFRPALAETV